MPGAAQYIHAARVLPGKVCHGVTGRAIRFHHAALVTLFLEVGAPCAVGAGHIAEGVAGERQRNIRLLPASAGGRSYRPHCAVPDAASARVWVTEITVNPREIDFVTRFQRNWEHLREIMGIMRPIRMQPGTVLKSKYAQGTLQSGTVAEGEEIPYSQYTVKEKDYDKITIEKYAKAVSLEAIQKYGYDVAVQKTDDEFLFDLTTKVTDKFYKYLNTGSLKGTPKTFQMALAMAKGSVENKFKNMHRTVTGVVGFANVLDVAEYLGTAPITIQNQYGFQYIKDFMGYNTIFLLSDGEIAKGKVIATPVDNIVMYYVDPSESDYAKAGLVYTTAGEANNLIGFHTQGNYTTAVSESFAITGVTLFAEYLDGISVQTITPGE